MTHERHYTVEQANAARPWVGERVDRIQEALDELPVDEELRDRRPARERGELLSDPWVRKDVHRRVVGSECVEHADDPRREPAARHLRRALHEQHHALPLDRLFDVVTYVLTNLFLVHSITSQ